MYPEVGRIGAFVITSFGVMVAAGVLVGLWVFTRQLRARGLPAEAESAALVGAVGGLTGAKLVWVIEFSGTAPVTQLLFSRAGLSWYGGLLGGLAAGIGYILWRRLPLSATVASAAPAVAAGHAIGRIGCFLVGDDYGKPSTLPWAVAFPDGAPPVYLPVHPTQIYEAIFLAGLSCWLTWTSRRGAFDRDVIGHYFLLTAGFRFFLEFIRVNEQVLLGLTVAQLLSLALATAGIVLLTRARHVRSG